MRARAINRISILNVQGADNDFRNLFNPDDKSVKYRLSCMDETLSLSLRDFNSPRFYFGCKNRYVHIVFLSLERESDE